MEVAPEVLLEVGGKDPLPHHTPDEKKAIFLLFSF